MTPSMALLHASHGWENNAFQPTGPVLCTYILELIFHSVNLFGGVLERRSWRFPPGRSYDEIASWFIPHF